MQELKRSSLRSLGGDKFSLTLSPLPEGMGHTLGYTLHKLVDQMEEVKVCTVKLQIDDVYIGPGFDLTSHIDIHLEDLLLNLSSLRDLKSGSYTINTHTPGKYYLSDLNIFITSPNRESLLFQKISDANFNIFLECKPVRGYFQPPKFYDDETQTFALSGCPSLICLDKYKVTSHPDYYIQETYYNTLVLHLSILQEDKEHALERLVNLIEELKATFTPEITSLVKELPIIEVVEESQPEIKTQSEMGWDIAQLKLSSRSIKCLRQNNIHLVSDLVERSAAELLDIHGFGKKCLSEVMVVIDNLDLKLKP